MNFQRLQNYTDKLIELINCGNVLSIVNFIGGLIVYYVLCLFSF